jgi:hypothetical protein
LLLLCFFITFFLSIDIGTALQTSRLLHTSFNDECTVTLSFSPACPSLSYHD